jgi:hypothetical protein
MRKQTRPKSWKTGPHTEPIAWDWFNPNLADADKALLGFNQIPRPEKSQVLSAPRFIAELMGRKTSSPAWYATLPEEVRRNAETIDRLSSAEGA